MYVAILRYAYASPFWALQKAENDDHFFANADILCDIVNRIDGPQSKLGVRKDGDQNVLANTISRQDEISFSQEQTKSPLLQVHIKPHVRVTYVFDCNSID